MKILKIIPIGNKLSQAIAIGVIASIFALANPLASQEVESITIDGSSTVYPITQKIAEEYQSNREKPVDIAVEFSGTGGGFDKFCRGETDINNASRPIQTDEMAACNDSQRFLDQKN